jgi:2-polyprenyl-3-methyl-5-hydroxy-6-metoxy-1,4-benzoquinol methylase
MAHEVINTCPVCERKEFSDFLSAKDHTTTGEEFQLKICSTCQLVITTPRPGALDIARYYDSQEYISHTGGKTGLFDTLYRLARNLALKQKLKLIHTYQPKPGTILDYGAGTGSFLTYMANHGWKISGVEPSGRARQKIPATITVHPDLENIRTEFDAITLWHVLEHVHNLRDTLTNLANRLKRTGTIFIAVPNYQSYDAQHYQAHWAGYDVPRHLWHFNKTNMKELLGTSGLQLRSVKPMKLDAFYVSLLSERYKNPTASTITHAFSAFATGLQSNLRAGTDNYSSLIYIAEK